ncbi:DsbC family protein [Chiayiivirga flava]|uniref:Thiol:disulfide interchange protein n=1 Tax=Chiayiivirga flava TaxID=659595 RepID=A0A7W8G010_9GAMM|nr:DsbC family protein [Chiayiivirga flava]MBB5208686.1 thiol:disulfide interchange protein DsbC [Chiayiivirga flava]
MRYAIVVGGWLVAGTVVAASVDEPAVRAAVARLAPDATVDSVADTPVPGFAQAVVDGQVVYVSRDGTYLLEGNLVDTRTRANLTEAARTDVRKAAFDRIGPEQRIAFEPDPATGKTQRRVTVYTDFDCGVCRRLHDQIAEYNALGIAVDYLFYPRSGIGSPSYDKAVSVWCAADRKSALTEAMRGAVPSPLQCDNPVDEQYAAGARMRFSGTPALYADDGSYLGGYLAPAQLRVRLDQIASTDP